MKLKYMLAAGAILFSCTASAQTAAGKAVYNSGSPIQRTSTHGIFVPNAEDVKSERRAAERGDASAQFKLALRYDVGEGVPQDYAEALKWLRRAADQDLVQAQYNLGCLYESGQSVSQDHAEAVKWFHKAAEQGYGSAQNNLSAMYGRGQGVPKNYAEAYVWSSIAVMSGSKNAISNRDHAANNLSPGDLGSAQIRALKLHGEIKQ